MDYGTRVSLQQLPFPHKRGAQIHQHSKGAITSLQLTKCVLSQSAGKTGVWLSRVHLVLLWERAPVANPRIYFSLWRAAAGQIHNSLNRSCYALYMCAIVAWRSVSIPVFVHYILRSVCNFDRRDAHNTLCLKLDLNIHLRIAERRPCCAMDLSARDLQQQFLCVRAEDEGIRRHFCSKLRIFAVTEHK